MVLDAIEIAVRRYDAKARLVPVHAAMGRRQPNRAADVRADLEAGEPHGHGCCGTPRRATGRASDVPRVVRGAEQFVVALVVAGPAGDIRLAEHHSTLGADRVDHYGVGVGDEVAQFDCTAGGADALGRKCILDGDGYASEAADLLAARPSLVDLGCFDFGPLGRQRDDRVDGPIEFVDAIEMHRQKFAGGNVLIVQRSNQRGE